MVEIEVGGEKRPCVASVLTLMLYEQEFGSDLIQDVYGKVTLPKEEAEREEGEIVLDFGLNNWTALSRALWACMRAADPSVPGFREWAAQAGDLNMWEVASTLSGELARGFFRAGAGGAGQGEAQGGRRKGKR